MNKINADEVVIHPSSLSNWLDCQLRAYLLETAPRPRSDEITDSALYGMLLEYAIATLIGDPGINSNVLIVLISTESEDILAGKTLVFKKSIQPNLPFVIASVAKRVIEQVPDLLDCQAQVEVEIDLGESRMRGRCDFILQLDDGTYHLFELKTGSQKHNPQVQLGAYVIAIEHDPDGEFPLSENASGDFVSKITQIQVYRNSAEIEVIEHNKSIVKELAMLALKTRREVASGKMPTPNLLSVRCNEKSCPYFADDCEYTKPINKGE